MHIYIKCVCSIPGFSCSLLQAWDQYFKPMNAVNFGIGGDTTENVLWRLENGELDALNPKVYYYTKNSPPSKKPLSKSAASDIQAYFP